MKNHYKEGMRVRDIHIDQNKRSTNLIKSKCLFINA